MPDEAIAHLDGTEERQAFRVEDVARADDDDLMVIHRSILGHGNPEAEDTSLFTNQDWPEQETGNPKGLPISDLQRILQNSMIHCSSPLEYMHHGTTSISPLRRIILTPSW
jgi:hypothetical protein